jgi:alpha-amylase
MLLRLIIFIGAIFVASLFSSAAERKIVLQGFWWDYWNNNYQNNWATYLADLAPRLKEMGVDAVWIPPTIKNKNATGSVGYSPFDHYDLGDKYQGGSTGTRLGTKDNLLRAISILHANGIEVIQDVVLNHMDGAGSDTGAGGQDPAAPSNKWKNFRYVSYATPGTSQDFANYAARRGRFPKNWQNFHPNPDHNTEGDDITAGYFGPDICYYSQARGLSSNMSYNPPQEVDYMRTGMRNWVVWMKKQTGVDGFRFDAVKHFETWAMQDFLWNLANNSGFASGGPNMFAVGEFVGSKSQLDTWVDQVNSANGGTSDLAGTFDFSLREALKGVIDGLGNYNLANIPGAQQNRRSRTVPFVNNHDTFRPQLDANGRYIGWNSGSEIGGHIDPNDPRIQLTYAVAFAVDGSAQIFFEDLFDLHSTGRRWTHHPTNTTQLPARDWLVNQLWCRQNLKFDEGAYRVRWQAADLLVIERSARALVAVNDNWTTTQSATVQTDFGPNVTLHDYSGAFPNDVQTDANGRVTISAPPCNGTNVRRGYSIWGPTNLLPALPESPGQTIQEWEMADDLGDSHTSSLRQGGALPANSIAPRTVGRIYPAAGTNLRIDGFSTLSGPNWEIAVLAPNLSVITNVAGPQNLLLNLAITNADFYNIRVRNTEATNPTQKVWVKATYTGTRNRLLAPPAILLQPTNIFATVGDDLQMQLYVSGAQQVIWFKDGVRLPVAFRSGTTNGTLTLQNVTTNQSGVYQARIINDARIVESTAVNLVVYPDANPTVTTVSAAQGMFIFTVSSRVGLVYEVQSSADLVNWVPEESATAPFALSTPATGTHRFFRIVPVAN